MKSFAAVMRILVAGTLMVLAGLAAALQAYPSKPIRIITSNAPGGGTTIVARLIGQKLTESWGQQVIVDNRPGANDLIGGQVQLTVAPPASSISYIKSGRLKAIAISSETRLPALPQVPTFTEAGLPGFEVKGWYGVLAPAGTPKAIIDKLASEIANVLAMPDIKEKIVSQGMDPFISNPDQFAALMKADMAKWGKVIKTANIKLEQ